MGRNEVCDSPRTILDILRRRGTEEPHAIAYQFVSETPAELCKLSYGEVNERAITIGAWLQKRGLAGKPVALIFPAGLEFVAALFGTLYAGAVAVPLDAPGAANPGPRLGALFADFECRFVLTTDSLVGRISRATEGVCGSHIEFATVDSVPEAGGAEWRDPRVTGDMLAVLQYTSGSTATPKGVKVRHGNLLHNIELMTQVSGHDRSSIGVSWLPHYHDMGLVAGILMPAHAGFPVILMSPASFLARPVRWLRAISSYRATVSGAPNFAYEHCIRKIRPDETRDIDLGSWRVACCGAEPIRPETIDRFAASFAPCGFRKEAFFPCYGLAEATLMVSGGPAGTNPPFLRLGRAGLNQRRIVESQSGSPDAVCMAGSGALIPDNEVIIVDPQRRTRCADDQIGEIWISGPSIAAGYWNRPRESEETFGARLADGGAKHFLRTGDLGFIRDGVLFVSGRLKDLIIIRGMNHYPQDIEHTVEDSDPALRPGRGAAFSIEVANEEKLVIAYELLDRVARPSETIFHAVVRNIAERHGLQVHCMVLVKPGTIPKTTSGKIQRQECRSRFLAGTLAVLGEWHASASGPLGSDAAEPTDPPGFDRAQREAQVPLIVIAEMARVLGADPSSIDLRQSIYTLGLDSLAAAQLRNRLASIFDLELDFSDLLAASTLLDLTDHISARVALRSSRMGQERAKRLLEYVTRLSEKQAAEALAAEARRSSR